jgi:hypothetical protein
MIRNALLVCAAIIVGAICFSCAPEGPSGPAMVGLAAQTPIAPSCTATDFQNKIQYLTAAFTPQRGASLPMPSAFPPGATFVSDLGQAFAAASPAFQEQLCKLDVVYINAAACPSSTAADCFDGSWGWRQGKLTTQNGRIVALSTGLWNEASYPDSYSHYETSLMQSVFPLPGTSYSNAQSCPSPGSLAGCKSVDNFTTTLLAALAHEVGHIEWYVLVDPGFPDTNPIGLACKGGPSFFSGSWLTVSHPPIGRRRGAGGEWRHFSTPGERTQNPGNWPDTPRFPPEAADIDAVANSYPGAEAILISNLLATTQPWASAFAAVSPDEDFVETYKFKVLTTANQPLTSVGLTIPTNPSVTYNIPLDYFQTKNGTSATGARAELVRKVACIPDRL